MIADPACYAIGVPYEQFSRLRREAPVSWVDEPRLYRHGGQDGAGKQQGPGFWAVTSHAAVIEASRAPQVFSSSAQGAFLADPRTVDDLERARQILVNMDAPEHARIRRHVTAAFTPRAVQTLAARIQQHADKLVGQARDAVQLDAVAELAAELPLLVLTDLLGVPPADRGLMLRWSNALVGFDDPEYGGGDVEAYRRTFFECFRYARALADERRRQPGDDLVSRLVNDEVGGHRLSDPEFCQLWLLLVIAGNETTRHLLSGALLALIEAPRQRARLIDDPGLTSPAVHELLRWITPIMQFRRTATVDTELAGQKIRAGDKVVLYYIAANRDPAVYPEPDQLDLARDPNPHLAFGIGPHYCLGSHLAALEARIMLDTLRPALAGLRAVGPAVRLESNFMNGLKSLPITLSG